MANRVSFYKYLLIAFLLASPLGCKAKVKAPNVAFRDSVLNLVFTYAKRTDTTGLHGSQSYSYTKMQMHTNKRNATLMLVPSMYAIAHGTGRHFISEYYTKITMQNDKFTDQRLLHVSTVPHRRNIMSYILPYVTPNVFGENLFTTISSPLSIEPTAGSTPIGSPLCRSIRPRYTPTPKLRTRRWWKPRLW